MATIYNNTEYTFSTSAQQAISNAAANCGVDEVNAEEGNAATLYDLFDNDDNYLFSIDIEGDNIFNR